MLAPRFRKAPQQLLLVGHEEDHLTVNAAAPELIDELGHGGDLRGRIACIEPDRGALVGRLGAADRVRDERLQQSRGNVVDAVKAEILEHVQGHALPGTGQSADDNDAHGVWTLSTPHDGRKPDWANDISPSQPPGPGSGRRDWRDKSGSG